MNVTFKNATLHDLNEIMDVIKTAIKNMNQNNIPQWDALYPTSEDFKDDIAKGYLHVGMVDSKIAVVYAVNKECDEAYKNGKWKSHDGEFCVIHRLCVNPNFQNQGIARKTLEHIEETQRKRGVKSIRLDVFSKNPYALKLYAHFGYEKVGEAEWRKGLFYLMEKQLW